MSGKSSNGMDRSADEWERYLEETHLAEATVDRALDRLEDGGLIRRDRDGDDLRYVHIETSENS